MKKSFLWVNIFLTLTATSAIASVPRTTFSNENDYLIVEVLSEDIFHFEMSSNIPAPGNSEISTSPYVFKKDFQGPKWTSRITFPFGETSTYKVKVNSQSLCVTIIDKSNQTILTTICPKVLSSNQSRLEITRGATKNLYGLGEEFRNPGNANGDWTGQVRDSKLPEGNTMEAFEGGGVGNASFPILYALGSGKTNYALYVDHLPAMGWDFKTDPWQLKTTGDTIRFYIIGGKDLPQLRRQFMDLVGHPLVPPKKAFGLWLSEFGYKNWDEMEDKLWTLRSKRFPIDGFVLDAFWGGPFSTADKGNHIGAMKFDPNWFPDPEKHIKDMAKRGLGLMLHEDPFINNWLPGFSEMQARDGLVKECAPCGPRVLSNYLGDIGIIDWTNDSTSDFWHTSKRQPLIDMGVTFHWTDFAELDGYGGNDWYHGVQNFDHSARVNHNIFPFKWAESIARGYQAIENRQFILSRSGSPGVQRFGAAIWSGDIGSNMNSLASHMNAQMHLSLSGIDYYGSDIGGYHRVALKGDLQDVYTKWFAHSSAFDIPVRPHTNNWDKKWETAPDRIGDRDANLQSLRLRYELSPYYYSLAHQAYQDGSPVLPPLIYFFQDDPNVRLIGDEKMIGPWILVAGAPLDGPVTKNIYLPAGEWTDYRTQSSYTSRGELISWDFNKTGHFELPYLVRAGAIFPTMWVDDLTMNVLGLRLYGSVIDDLNLRVYPSGNTTSAVIFEDDGLTTNYKKGLVAQTKVSQELNGSTLDITVDPTQGTYKGAPANRKIVLRIKCSHFKSVSLNGELLRTYGTRTEFEKSDSGSFLDSNGLLIIRTPAISVTEEKKFQIVL